MFNNTINKVFILGYLGSNPVISHTSTGISIVKINIATNMNIKNKETNKFIQKTEWHKVILYNKIAEFMANFADKGTLVFLEGSLQTDEWQTEAGIKRETKIIATRIQIIDNKKKNNNVKTVKTDENNNDFTTFDEKTPF